MQQDISIIEAHKENIQTLPGGRSVKSLVSAFKKGTVLKQRDEIKQARDAFEQELQLADELDDPLEVYLNYINWCHNTFPQGNTIESGLLKVLERCTTDLRDAVHYKNDVRYMKVWLEYAKYSDSPTEIFIYLAKKQIGRELALYYEEFAKVLELNQKYNDAKEVYEIGIMNAARPTTRLLRSFDQFQKRKELYPIDKSDATIKSVLTLKRGTNPSSSSEVPVSKKPKINVFVDDADLGLPKNLFDGAGATSDARELGTIHNRKKENIVTAKPWSGEVLAQQKPSLKDSSSGKIQVYRDTEPEPPIEDVTQQELKLLDDKVTTLVKRPGKNPESVHLNLELLYQSGSELSLVELLKKGRELRKHQKTLQEEIPTQKDPELSEHTLNDRTETFTIPLRAELAVPQSPTMTYYSKMANKDVLNMFNSVSHHHNDEYDDARSANSTNYDGFVTETIHAPAQTLAPAIIDPFLESLREKLLSEIDPALETYPGFNNTRTQFIEAIRRFRAITDKDTKIVNKLSSSSIVNFCGNEIYSLKCELGQGGYGYVYLIENEIGALKALKAETISSCWEFYILNQVHLRLEAQLQTRIVKPESLFMYKDESFLILNYLSQGTVLDVVNYYKDQGENMEEIMCMFFTVELLRVVEGLHKIGVIHGDLKADNCMIDFKNTFSLPDNYSSDSEWTNAKLVLIDFGRAIDLSMFPEGTEFLSTFKTDQQDCPQMNEKKPWSYEADYYGIAATIHTFLYGRYITITKLPSGKYKLQSPFKRYWQVELWQSLFDVLLNPYYNSHEKYPLLDELKYQRTKFEQHLINNSSKLGLKRVVNNIERDARKITRGRA